MSEDTTQSEEIKNEMDKFFKRQEEIKERVKTLDIIHEHIVVIHRLENIEILTFLHMAETTLSQRRRSSWYGQILNISQVDCGDSIIEGKKQKIKIGDIVSFNPESAYSLNIAGFEEIWILHIDNILVVDTSYDYIKAKQDNVKKRFEIQSKAAHARMQSVMAKSVAEKISEKTNKQLIVANK